MKKLFITLIVLVVIGALTFCGIAFIPLDNDKECYEVAVEAHNSIKELNSYNAFKGRPLVAEIGEDECPVCNPLMWRFNIRIMRWKSGL